MRTRSVRTTWDGGPRQEAESTVAADRRVVAYRYRCSVAESPLCDRGDGAIRPKARCRHRRNPIVTDTGQWGAFYWALTGEYRIEDAVQTFATSALAHEWADPQNLVVRFVADAPQPGSAREPVREVQNDACPRCDYPTTYADRDPGAGRVDALGCAHCGWWQYKVIDGGRS